MKTMTEWAAGHIKVFDGTWRITVKDGIALQSHDTLKSESNVQTLDCPIGILTFDIWQTHYNVILILIELPQTSRNDR